jgi:hypothetical protein
VYHSPHKKSQLLCKQRAKAEDLPDPYKCPRCTGDFDKLLNQYMSNPQTSITSRDFCDFCGLEAMEIGKGGQGHLIPCKKCDRAFHTKCADETEELFRNNNHWHWECPECSGAAAEVFTWSRLIVPAPPPEKVEEIFIEHKRAGGQVAPMDLNAGDGLGGPEEAPAGRGKKSAGGGRGRPAKGGRVGKSPAAEREPTESPREREAPSSSRAAARGVVYREEDDEEEPASSEPKKRRGRPPKNANALLSRCWRNLPSVFNLAMNALFWSVSHFMT